MNLTKKVTAWLFTMAMVLTLLPQTLFAQETAFSLQYEVVQEMNEDKTESTISLEFTETETIQLEKVTLPDGREVKENKAVIKYDVLENGKYDFKVDYLLNGVEQEEIIPVEVMELVEKKADEEISTEEKENLSNIETNNNLLQVDENTYEVSNGDELTAALEQIKNGQKTEATIELSANLDNGNDFVGVSDKKITVKSITGQKYVINLGNELQGDITLDNVKLSGKEEAIYANGNRFETTNAFEGEITNIYGGGNESTEVNSDTYLILRGGIFRSIYGGGYNSTVNGNTHVIFDGAIIEMNSFGSGQRIIGGGYGDASNKGVVNGNTNVEIISGTLGITTSTINNGVDNGCGIYAGGFNNSKSDFSTSAMVTGNTNLVFGGKKDGDIIAGNENGYVNGANYAAGSYRSTILGNANLTLKEGSQMAYIDQYGYMKTPNLYGGGLEDHIKGTVTINVTGGNNMKWQDNKGSQDGINLYLGGKIDKDGAINTKGPTIENQNNEPYAVTFNMTGGKLAKVYARGNVSPFYANSVHTEINGDVKLNVSGFSTVIAEIHGSYGGNFEENNQLSKSEITISNGAQFRSVSDTEKLTLNHLGTEENEAPIKLLQRINDVSIENSYVYMGYKAWYAGNTTKSECMPWVKSLTLKNSILHTDDNAITTVKNHKISNTGALTADLGAMVTMEDSSWIADEVIEIYGSMNMKNSKLILKSNSMGGYVLANFNSVKENFHSENSELYLNTVDPQTGNYHNNVDNDPTKVIRLQINGKASGDCKVYTVEEGQGTKLEKPQLSGNYIIANTQSDFNTFQLANEDALEDGLGFVKKYGRIKTTTGGSGIDKKLAIMWQIGNVPLPKYDINYTFKSLDEKVQLPESIQELEPQDEIGVVTKGSTVNAPENEFKDVKVIDGVWTFKGWTPSKHENVTSNVEFVGTWKFKRNMIDLNHVPTINANDKTLTVGDTFDPFNDVTATDKEDGDITKEIEILKNEVDINKAGVYEVTYKVTDSQGASTVASIKVTVKAKDTPVVPMEPEKPNKPNDSNEEIVPDTSVNDKNPQTGDSTKMIIWTLLFIVSSVGLMSVYYKRRKMNQ